MTNWIEERANALLKAELEGVNTVPSETALAGCIKYDFVDEYVNALEQVINIEAIQQADIKIGVDPMGGAGLATWQVIAQTYGLNLTLTNTRQEPGLNLCRLTMTVKFVWIAQVLMR